MPGQPAHPRQRRAPADRVDRPAAPAPPPAAPGTPRPPSARPVRSSPPASNCRTSCFHLYVSASGAAGYQLCRTPRPRSPAGTRPGRRPPASTRSRSRPAASGTAPPPGPPPCRPPCRRRTAGRSGPANRRRIATCCSVIAVPRIDTTLLTPNWWAITTSVYPSTTTTVRRLDDSLPRQVQPEDAAALGKQRRFRAVQVLRRVFRPRHHPPAERDHPAVLVADREHQAVAERVVEPVAVLARLHQPAAASRSRRELPPDGPLQQRVPRVRRQPDLEPLDRLGVDAALLQVLRAAAAPCSGSANNFSKNAQAAECASSSTCRSLGLLLRDAVLRHLDARPARPSELQRVDELDAVALDHEVDRVAARLAPVAVEELLASG